MKPPLSPEQVNELIARYAAGEATSELAKVFGVHPSYPTILMRRRGLPLRKPGNGRPQGKR